MCSLPAYCTAQPSKAQPSTAQRSDRKSSVLLANRSLHVLFTPCIRLAGHSCLNVSDKPLCSAVHPNATPKGHRQHMGVTWSPFSYGPHSCIGQGLAMQELRTVLAVFLSRFKFGLPGSMLCLHCLDAFCLGAAWLSRKSHCLR